MDSYVIVSPKDWATTRRAPTMIDKKCAARHSIPVWPVRRRRFQSRWRVRVLLRGSVTVSAFVLLSLCQFKIPTTNSFFLRFYNKLMNDAIAVFPDKAREVTGWFTYELSRYSISGGLKSTSRICGYAGICLTDGHALSSHGELVGGFGSIAV